MNPLLIYMVKSAVYLSGFYLVYFLFLSRDTNFNRNRFYLVASILGSLVLPVINIDTGNSAAVSNIGKTISAMIVYPEKSAAVQQTVTNGSTITLVRIYLAGVIIFGLKLLIDLVRLGVQVSKKGKRNGNLIRISGKDTSGYSAFGYVFINESISDDEFMEILNHEMNHLHYCHFYDILLIELVTVFQWFNPVIYLTNRSLRSVHEYQADQKCLSAGVSVSGYQRLLFGQILKSRIFLASNSFSNPSLLKKRMIMMTKKPSSGTTSLKILLVIPVISFLVIFISACSATKHGTRSMANPEPPQVPTEIFVVVEEMPEYPGGTEALMKFVNSNLQYPKEAKDKNIQGRVIIRFSIMYDGSVDNVQVMKGVDPLLDAEAIRVAKLLKGWKPGKQGGLPVNVWYSMPVMFQLK